MRAIKVFILFILLNNIDCFSQQVDFEKYYSSFVATDGTVTLNNKDAQTHKGPNGEVFEEQSKRTFKMRWWAVGVSDALGAWRWGRVGAVVAGGPAGALACGFAGACAHSLGSLIAQSAISQL